MEFLKKKIRVNRSHSPLKKEDDRFCLQVDVFEEDGILYIVAPLAGVELGDIDVSIHDDVLKISGSMSNGHDFVLAEDQFFLQECYWGRFQRSIVLPVEVDYDNVDAYLKHGILTITMPLVEDDEDESS